VVDCWLNHTLFCNIFSKILIERFIRTWFRSSSTFHPWLHHRLGLLNLIHIPRRIHEVSIIGESPVSFCIDHCFISSFLKFRRSFNRFLFLFGLHFSQNLHLFWLLHGLLWNIHHYIIDIPMGLQRLIINALSVSSRIARIQATILNWKLGVVLNLFLQMLTLSLKGCRLSSLAIDIPLGRLLLQHKWLRLHSSMTVHLCNNSHWFDVGQLKFGLGSWWLNILLSRCLSFLNGLFLQGLSHMWCRVHVLPLFFHWNRRLSTIFW
jgi:hypothetical protein